MSLRSNCHWGATVTGASVWGAIVAGEQVSGEQMSREQHSDRYVQKIDLIIGLIKSDYTYIRNFARKLHKFEMYMNSNSAPFWLAKYRKYPLCKLQLKAKQPSGGTYKLYSSAVHDHQQRNPTTRLSSPIRENIIRMSDNALVTSQINKVMKALHPDLSIDTKKLQLWYSSRQNVPQPNKQHDIFIPYYVVNDVNDLFICLTTRQLLSACKYSSVLAIDCTYKITTNELPLLVSGTSDCNRRFYPMGICLISTDESADTFRTVFRGIQQWVSAVNNQPTQSHMLWLMDHLVSLTSAMSEISLARRLMCWFHMIPPRTNNGLESLNGRIKKDYTLRNRLPLFAFFKTAERMLMDWSTDSKKPFQLYTIYKDHLKLAAYTWLQQVDKTQILQVNPNVYVVPSKHGNMSTTTWVQQFYAMAWSSYDEFANWPNSARLVNCSRLLPPLFCACQTGLKEYTCVHALGLLMLWSSQLMP
ncbi:unnamed protein product [Didymodactylos carnosus]|uniref:MULE transposase domain-containing protein n=1 Tax=Didymodactylos carnosus TaxID=1234261 RepID=A0A814XTA9_9BILA|nr:unnamed protein product [Didymodactylos carnosus]CAF1220132.1 unnamed protein product [Didymodactylos carnosus]CAF3671354.1 unnamed protein product [Didymodactylos carnosus]CAF3983577.1 unnamed protein product [Didymodactylos carnosus]